MSYIDSPAFTVPRISVHICSVPGMSHLACVTLYPLLFLISIPLVVFAFLTTAAAFSTLLFRVLLVYADLAAVLIKTHLLQHHPPEPTLPKRPHPSTSGERTRSSSGDSHGSRTPKSAESSGLGIYSVGSLQRDFEGVGGWRIPNTEGDDVLWTSMNARLELPASADGHRRHHRRSITSGGRPAFVRSSWPEEQHGMTTANARFAGPPRREDYFKNRHASKSTTELGTAAMSRGSI